MAQIVGAYVARYDGICAQCKGRIKGAACKRYDNGAYTHLNCYNIGGKAFS